MLWINIYWIDYRIYFFTSDLLHIFCDYQLNHKNLHFPFFCMLLIGLLFHSY